MLLPLLTRRPVTGHAETALQLIGQVETSFPGLARPRLQRIGLERRRGRLQECHRLYAAATEAAPPQLTTWWAMKHARFCFKVSGTGHLQPDI